MYVILVSIACIISARLYLVCSLLTIASDTGIAPVLSSTVFLHIETNKELNVALYEAVLHTGKTHQLRLHFSESGLPIVGTLYMP